MAPPRLDGDDPRAALRAALVAHRRPALSRLLARRGLGPYRGYGEMLEAVERLVDRGARLSLLGRSVRGEPLFGLRFGAEDPREQSRTGVVLSGVHPMEWIGIEVHLALLERLVAADLGGRSVLAVPIVNPDGLLRVEMNLREGRRRFVRHNAHGVDLNRNFDARWGYRSLAQRLLWFLFSPGKHAASEPEVAAIAHALSARRVDRAVSLHSFGGAVLYPPAGSLWPVVDRDEHRAWATRIARAADPQRPYRAMSLIRFGCGFRQGGLELDWFHERHGALSLLVECSRGGVGLRPSRLLDPFAWYNPPRIHDVAPPLVDALSPFVKGLSA